jgi:hypothetical protein
MLERRQHVGIVAATFVACALAAAACGGDDSTPTQEGTPDAAASEAGLDARASDAGADGAAIEDSSGPGSEGGTDAEAESGGDTGIPDGAGDDGPGAGDGGCVSLDVKNYKSWCSVSVAAGAFSTSDMQVVCVAPGTVDLAAKAASPAFKLGPAPWHHTTGDKGSGDPGTVTGVGPAAQSATTVVVSAAGACAWICCPFATGTGCPLVDQCP